MPIVQSATVPHNTFCQFYHVYVHEINTNQVANKQEFLSKLNIRLKRPPSGEGHWQNAHSRFELVRPHLRKLSPHTLTEASLDATFLPSHVGKYAALTIGVISDDPSTNKILFEDSYFYWSILKAKAGDDFEKRKVLLEVLIIMRKLGKRLMYTSSEMKLGWVRYHPNSSFLRNLLKSNQAKTRKVKFFSRNEALEESFGVILKKTHTSSDILQKRLEMFQYYHKGIIELSSDPIIKLSELGVSEIHSQLGPLQDYFPEFMRERSMNLSRSFLAITLSKRYLQKMKKTGYYPSLILENAVIAFSHLCKIYLNFWRSFPHIQARAIFSRKLIACINEKINIVDNALYGCTAESFDSAIKIFGISGIALPQTPHDGDADSLALVEQKEFRISLEAFAYRDFYSARFHNRPGDMSMHFKDALTRPQEDQKYAALVLSWIRAKTYPSVKLPFIITKDQNDTFIDHKLNVVKARVFSVKDDLAWKKFQMEHVIQKLELERLVHDLSDDPVWRELQLEYIRRLECFIKQMQTYLA